MCIRPTDSKLEPCNHIGTTVSVSQTGVYFRSSVSKYEVGMRLFLTLPYSNEPADLPHEYLTEVVRRVALPNGLFGIGLRILIEVGPQDEDG
jgi:PilZ domain